MEIKRGDVYYVDLDPVLGSEQGGTRPVLIIQNEVGNKYAPTVIVAPITGKNKKRADMPVHCILHDCGFLEKESVVLLEQIRTIDKLRLDTYIGRLRLRDMEQINRAILISMDLSKILEGGVF